jgi:hypothetical protein
VKQHARTTQEQNSKETPDSVVGGKPTKVSTKVLRKGQKREIAKAARQWDRELNDAVTYLATDCRVSVAEVFSVPRVTALANKWNFISKGAYDIKCGDDFRVASHRERTRQKLSQERPDVLLLTPPCNQFSKLQNLNDFLYGHHPEYVARRSEKYVEARIFLKFCVSLARDQVERGGKVILEHPKDANSWLTAELQRLLEDDSFQTAVFDQCMFNLRLPGTPPQHKVKKFTRIIGNLDLSSLAKSCDHSHYHIQAIGGIKTKSGWAKRSALAGRYPRELCEALEEAAHEAHL